MPKPLDGTVAIVTGASSGIGEATATALAQLGARVVVAECDVSDEGQVERLVARAVDELGRLNMLINNAGVMLLGRVEVVATMQRRFGSVQRLEAGDIAGAVLFMVTRPRHVAINEMLVRPTEQAD